MNKQQLANKIWASANKMRSKIEANEYKDYILGLIFYKFLSDNEVNYLKSIGWTDEDIVTLVENHEDQEAVMMMEYCRNKDMLKAVGIPSPEKRMHDYSFQMSGGMRQHVMIAMSLCLDPDILIADEPTTALDVTVQAQILDLLREMQDRVGASIIMITHDLGVVAEVSDKVAVMYAGRKVEEGSVEQILFNPQHPYTKALKGLYSAPPADAHKRAAPPARNPRHGARHGRTRQGPLFVLRALSVREAGMHGAQPARKGDRRRT